ncbi:hypothetical protein [Burkholderia cenocepacia]|uniref:hypothetical protein n=1 Tax=Burkholderia cenocepacia TaxID=95486 RepID=UPI0011159658|nr:hypothetical protein [Burkholderia cenocepacia]
MKKILLASMFVIAGLSTAQAFELTTYDQKEILSTIKSCEAITIVYRPNGKYVAASVEQLFVTSNVADQQKEAKAAVEEGFNKYDTIELAKNGSNCTISINFKADPSLEEPAHSISLRAR